MAFVERIDELNSEGGIIDGEVSLPQNTFSNFRKSVSLTFSNNDFPASLPLNDDYWKIRQRKYPEWDHHDRICLGHLFWHEVHSNQFSQRAIPIPSKEQTPTIKAHPGVLSNQDFYSPLGTADSISLTSSVKSRPLKAKDLDRKKTQKADWQKPENERQIRRRN